MMVDLVWLAGRSQAAPPNWHLGQVHLVTPTVPALNDLLARVLSAQDAFLFWSADLGQPDPALVAAALSGAADVWHAGLALGLGGLPHAIDFVAPTWMLNSDPPADIEATSWRVSLRACLARADVLRQMGFLRPIFESLDAAALEWGHRCIRRGVVMRHLPALLPSPPGVMAPELPLADELRFVRSRFGRKWQVWANVRFLLTGRAGPLRLWRANRQLSGDSFPPDPPPYLRPVPAIPPPETARVSVLVPTIDRYPYLRVLLAQLRQQTHPPFEIIIVDQTPASSRDAELYNDFHDLPLKVMFLDRAGQCVSRNAGLQAATGEYILFIDDDDEIAPDLIERHLRHLHQRRAGVSSGVAHEVGAGPLPPDFTYARVSDVFPTNNSLIERSLLLQSGLFDLAYDHGARADADLGMRLYHAGVLMLLNPDIDVLHHHAPRGGLRLHKARVVTYASSRARLWQRQLPSPTEMYLLMRYFTLRQARETLWISVLATFSARGSRLFRFLKVVVSLFLLPETLLRLRRSGAQARHLLENYPIIPGLDPSSPGETR